MATLGLASAAYVAWRHGARPAIVPAAPPLEPPSASPSESAYAGAFAVFGEDAGRPWLAAAVDDEPDAAFTGDVAYDCSGLPFADAAPPGCDDTPTPLSRLVEASENDPWALPEGPTEADWDEWRDALAAAAALDPATMTRDDRIVAQNAALRIGVRSLHADQSDPRHDVTRPSARLVARLALPAAQLDVLGDAPAPELEAWLGSRSQWVDKRPFQRPLMHDGVFLFSMAFRPFQAGRLRAMMGQLVAIDVDGRAHVTPLVGKVELRRGRAHAAPACVLVRDPRRARCGVPAGLRAVTSLDQLPKNTFFRRTAPGRVGCESCHGGSSPFHLGFFDAGDAAEQLRDRRASFLASASDRAAELARRATE